MPKSRETSRRIVITGVTRGLGRALAMGFAALGHTVAGCGRSTTAIEELRSMLGPPHELRVLDVMHDEQAKEIGRAHV